MNVEAKARKETRVAQEMWRAVWKGDKIEAFINAVKLRHAFHLNAEAKARKETRVAQEKGRAVRKGGEIKACINVNTEALARKEKIARQEARPN